MTTLVLEYKKSKYSTLYLKSKTETISNGCDIEDNDEFESISIIRWNMQNI